MKIYIENDDVTISATKKSANFSTREVCNMLSMAATQDETVLRPDRTRTFHQPIEPMPETQFLDRKQTSAVFSPQKHAEPVQDSDEGSMVLAKIKCPQCGNDQDQEVEHFHKFVFCPKCSTKLFLKWTMSERYEKDENGYARIAERVFDEDTFMLQNRTESKMSGLRVKMNFRNSPKILRRSARAKKRSKNGWMITM